MTGIIYMLNNLVQIIQGVFFLEQLGKPRFRFTVTCGIYAAGIALIYAAYRLFSFSASLHSNLRIALAVAIVLGLYHDKILKRAAMLALLTAISFAAEYIGLGLCSVLYDIPMAEVFELVVDESYTTFVMLMCADIMFILYLICSIIWRRKELMVHGNFRQLGIMLVFVIIHIAIVIFYYMDISVLDSFRNQVVQTFLQAVLYSALIFNYFNALRTRRLTESEQTLKHLQTEMEHNYMYYTLADEKFTEVSRLRHDVLNQIQTVQQLLRTGRNEQEAHAIMERIEEQLASAKSVHFCLNPIVNAVLTVKMNAADTRDIDIDIILSDCDNLPFDNYDICSLFANLYDNAAEACQRIDDGQEKFMEMRSGIHNGFFVLRLRNSSKPVEKLKKGELPKTEKEASGHGYGTRIIESITKKYDGSFTLSYEDGVMTAVAALKMEQSV